MHGLLYIIFNSSVYYLAVEPNEWKERIRNRKKIRAMNANFTLRKLKNNEDLYSLTFYQARGCLTSCHFNKYCVYLCNFFQKYYHCIHITRHAWEDIHFRNIISLFILNTWTWYFSHIYISFTYHDIYIPVCKFTKL